MGDSLVLRLPDDAVQGLGWKQGDELSASIKERQLHLAMSVSLHDRAMTIAEEAMVKYRDAFATLATS